ncbi:hemolysin activation/secretion protein [Cupriavidus sp. OV038]|uniref:ShlB/FhaC/HecB family hemolysin secretion/activation protein n=1 Tax=unclassified Cupriavidus TaxID=2640874 RepID=UPI0008EB0A3B|nr:MULTISPECIES: ShlB/FhaC/HecB family hemolysin secretion/activation protein [unclassified Cupriavidus]SFC13654.1 hemolysin activation/secretion protein [Cupriavidus sp. OV038]SFP09241.1 hemolysin activation/secretion protein [Cupriavidus sp. OV096]
MHSITLRLAVAASLATSIGLPVFPVLAQALPSQSAALTNAEQDQRTRQQQEARERAAIVQAPAVRAEAIAAAEFPTLPEEAPCFRIGRILLEVPQDLPADLQISGASALPMDPFAFAQQWLDHYTGACVGKAGVELLVKGISQAILSKGYVTTRVLVPEQDLTTGMLKLALIPGVVGEIRFAEPDLWGTWRTAFPTGPGELLNLRDLEQGLEQMKRVASQDVDMQIVPTATPGRSDVVIAIKRNKPWTVVASVDNSGSRGTGRWQGNLSLGIDNPLGLNDMFNVGYNQDLMLSNKEHGTRGWNGYYSVPWGYWTATVSAYSSNYFQQIAGVNTTFISSGKSQNVDLKLHRVLHRNQNDVFGMQVRLTRRFGKSYIEDTEIPQQRRNNTILEIGVTDRHYFGQSQLDASFGFRQGIGALGAQPDALAAEDGPTWRYRMMVLDANLSVPFKIAEQGFRYVTTVRGQFTNDRLYYVDDLTIGSRYTVRGFDGESQLAGERGFYWRNELQAPLGGTGQAIYAGIDYGRVYGPTTAALVGTQLAGAVVGLRGGLGSRFGSVSYDVFVGTPVYKPEAFHTAGVTGGMQLVYQY